jgi:predicted membrane protein
VLPGFDPDEAKAEQGFRRLALLSGVMLALLLIGHPDVARNRWGDPDWPSLICLLAAMGAGLSSGLGVRPRSAWLASLFSSGACLAWLIWALACLLAR